ncbi:uncharacterized protein si:dkeyp-121d4.3 isoform X2 [Toxotes jaculatrix]|uniref:uncharacterized protein si:dkeyp-121d4.3 isoform X2 n=1 Tax=Toxotes jaculatrix TaxID=941984 RepID=UPI001B3AC70F|nr:uncharacterized protein si:dkeyp-121d4.3 isoform X2 [Toxotes jaculatrix]
MGRGKGPTRGRHPMGPPGEDGPPFDMGPPGWGPHPHGGWGPPPPDGWAPPPGGWGPPPHEEWDPRGPPPPDWGPRGLPPPGWGPPHPDDWLPPPEDWGPHPDDWRLHPDDWRPPREHWRPPPEDWGPDKPLPPPGWGHPGWSPEGPPEPWGPEPGPPGPGPPGPVPPVLPLGMPPPVGIPPPDPAAYGPVSMPPVPPPSCAPPFGFPAYPPPGWTVEPVVEEPMPNPPPDQPEWIKALISAPATESTPADSKKSTEEPAVTKPPAADPTSAPKPKPKLEAGKTAKALGLLGKRTFDKPPPGRSTGIISFIGPTFGYIEREDLEKFTFSFDAFFGNPKAMTPGVRVHFTACKEKNNLIATDVKVAPGGTENVDTEIYEAVVSQPITEPQPGERQYPGQVHVTVGPLRTNLTFDRKDSTVTLLKNDQVLINLLTDIVTEKRRATNIKPKIPATFSHTKETREKGVIISLKDGEGIIRSDKHFELPFDIKENFSDVEFTAEDINEEVEFTVITLKTGKQAIRIRRVKEPLLLTLCTAAATGEESEAENTNSDSDGDSSKSLRGKANAKVGPNMKLDTELYEGIVSQPIIEPTPSMPGYPGQIHANIGPVRTNVTFDHRDCGVTLLKNDHVLINLLVDMVTRKRRAANIKPKIPFTFSYTKEKRELGVITYLGAEEGIINSEEHGELPFDVCENFSDTEFNAGDIHKEVEFTTALVKSKKRAIRLRRTKRIEDKILEEQKRREEEEKRKKHEEEERRKQGEEERKRREEEEEREKEAEKKKKEEVAAALAAAKDKWTPLGFKIRDPSTLDDISKERFEGTVLKAISRNPRKEIKKEPQENEEEWGGGGVSVDGKTRLTQVKIKLEKMDEDEKQKTEGREGKMEVKKEKEDEVEVKKDQPAVAGGGAKPDPEMGRLVMTVDGHQKQLPFGPSDLLTTATMLDGDKVRFNIATHRETKEERATYVEIVPDSFEESTEQRRHGIVIEFSDDSGLIKCSQNPQLFFHMSEVIEKKKLELNEKVEFSIVPHETAEGGTQAIRIKRYTENIFLPVRKLGGVGANKGKMTIKLTKASEDTEKGKPETDKLKVVVKNLRAQDSKTSAGKRDHSSSSTWRKHGRSRSRSRSHSRSRARSRSRSRSRSPPRDQFGRIIKRRRSTSIDQDHKSSRYRRSRERSRRCARSRTNSRSRSQSRSKSSSRSRSRSRERSKDRAGKRRSRISRDREDSHRRRRDLSPPLRRGGVMDDELARKKRELEELNEMIAYKKSLVDMDPRGLDPGQRTCIDYDHGRITVPLTEYKPVRSILKKRPDGPEYHHHPPQPYDDPYYDRPYGPYQDRRYGDRYSDLYTSRPYADHPYGDRPYTDHPYESRLYSEPPYGGSPSASHRYTDRYDVYDEPYDDRYYDPAYSDQPYSDLYRPVKQSHSPEPHGPSPSPQSTTSTQPSSTHTAATSSSQTPFRPPSPTEPPPRSPSPKLKNTTPHQSPPPEKPPLDRFLDMLNKKVDAEKKSESVHVNDDLLPHERALQDGGGFSRIVGLAQEQPSSSQALEAERKQLSPKRSSVERTSDEPKSKTEPYDKIQSLLRTIGLKLSTGDMSKLASRAQEKIYSPKSSSTERETLSSPREELRTSRTGSVESDHIHSPSPVRSSSLEPLSRHKAVSEYEGFLDQQELEVLKKAQQLHNLTKTMGSTLHNSPPIPPVGSPSAQYQHPLPPVNWPLGVNAQMSTDHSSTSTNMGTLATGQPPQRFGFPPGPPPGPPPRHPGQPPFAPPSNHSVLPFIGQPHTSPSPDSRSPPQPLTTATGAQTPSPSSTPATSGPANNSQSAISTTVARCLKVIETVKSLAVQPPAKTVKSVQFSLPTESPSASCPQASETDDDIKTKQKEKLDLYNQRILEKREQQFQEMLVRKKQGERNKEGTVISPGRPMSEPRNVWICGHSLVYWAESRAKSPEVGMQLGMEPSKVAIWWKGIQGMTWSQLLPQLHQLKVTWPNPDVLIMHLGGNDLSTDSPTDLLASVKKDLTSMRSIFPQCVLVWSNILPRRVWRHSADSHEVDLVRTTVNRRIQNIISELGGTSLTHDNIRCGTNTGLYRADGVHLSPKGIDVFNLNLQDFLEKWEMEVNRASERS